MEIYISGSGFPTKVTDVYWVFAYVLEPQSHPKKFKQNKSGKWLVFSDIKEHDSTWQKIKQATQDGLLGIRSKAATAKPNLNANSEGEKVICVYTYNWLDVDDVYRVEKTLREIGVEQTLFYKIDNETLNGQYKVNGSKNISKYISKATKSYDKFDLASLYGVGRNKMQILNQVGIKSFDDLIAFDTSKKLLKVGISIERINKLKLLALSQIENRIYQLTPIEFPKGEIVHFDIETDLSDSLKNKKVWSIAIHHNKKVKHFYADTWKEEKRILEEFLAYIKEIDNLHLFSYSGVGFDKSIISLALKRYELDYKYFLNCNHYDLCTLIKQNYVLPIKSYGLKSVGKYFGYKFKHENLDGLFVAMKYLHCQEIGKKLPKRIFDYINDDVKSMDYIINQLTIRKDIKQII